MCKGGASIAKLILLKHLILQRDSGGNSSTKTALHMLGIMKINTTHLIVSDI